MKKEQKLIEEMLAVLKEKMQKDYQKGSTKRDAHPKALGLLKANFEVLADIPEHLKIGLFKTPKVYKSWIRCSSASGSVQSDKNKDFRGFSIKLLGIEGERFTQNEQQTQDFVLLSNPTMPLGTVQLFRDAVYYSIKWNPIVLGLKFLFSGNASALLALANGRDNQTSPLDIPYWSTTPYQLGTSQVKYKIVPTSASVSTLPTELTDNYLTDAMTKHLQKEAATFDFYIQFFKNEELTPIENAGIEWKEADSPFIKMATITIPMQSFDTVERQNLAEVFSFSTANALAVHEPIGGLNRARRIIYEKLSKFRHERDNKALLEPTLVTYDAIS